MEILLLGIYAFFVWLIFIKFKLLPWTTPWKVARRHLPRRHDCDTDAAVEHLRAHDQRRQGGQVRGAGGVAGPGTGDRGSGREQPAREEGRRAVPDRSDPYKNEVKSLVAQLASEEAKVGAERTRLSEAEAKLPDAQSSERQLDEQLNEASAQVRALTASYDLARTRVSQNTELVAAGAGNRFDLERAQTDVNNLTGQLAAARAAEQQVREKLSGRVKGDLAAIAQVRAQIATARAQVLVAQAQVETTRAKLDNARWDLEQTTVRAPADGTMVNVMLRPGFFVAGMPFNEVMTFVDNEYQIFAMFNQNELHQVANGNEAEITLDTYPGRVIKAHVDSIIWAQGQGQLDASGDLPRTTFVAPPGRFPVKLVVGEQDKALFLAAGARGAAALYTEHLTLVHIIRKVLLRVQSYFDYIIIKHSLSLGH